jgi:hypothetical protein
MNRPFDVMLRGLLLMTLALPILAPPAAAQEETERGVSLDLFGAYLRGSGEDAASTRSLGLRGGYRFSRTWAMEGSLSRLDEDVQVWFGDVSAKAYFVHAPHFELYALGGLGEFKIRDGGDGADRSTVHLGIGGEISLSRQAYLRPEVRRRWEDHPFGEDGFNEYSLGFGWRF